MPDVNAFERGRDHAQGRRVFAEALCGRCHAFGEYAEGGGLAPSLSSVRTEFDREFILRSILSPSESMNGQHSFTTFHLRGGRTVTGRIVEESGGKLKLVLSLLSPEAVATIDAQDILSQEPSPVSPMPEGLVDRFSREEILDLIAFLVSGGNPDDRLFAK